jgi:plasmid maintenance system killer protein
MWEIDQLHQSVKSILSQANMTTFNQWLTDISNGEHPKTAAEKWDSNYEWLNSEQKYSIRLSKGNRVTFTLDTKNKKKVITIYEVGGHY